MLLPKLRLPLAYKFGLEAWIVYGINLSIDDVFYYGSNLDFGKLQIIHAKIKQIPKVQNTFDL